MVDGLVSMSSAAAVWNNAWWLSPPWCRGFICDCRGFLQTPLLIIRLEAIASRLEAIAIVFLLIIVGELNYGMCIAIASGAFNNTVCFFRFFFLPDRRSFFWISIDVYLPDSNQMQSKGCFMLL